MKALNFNFLNKMLNSYEDDNKLIEKPVPLPHIAATTTLSCCFVMAVMYVASLYVWKNKHGRDHPETIKRRFCSVFVMMLIAPLFVYYFSSPELLQSVSFAQLLGIRWQGLWQATLIPYLLTVLLFLGPIFVQTENESLCICLGIDYWRTAFTDILWLRNHIVAPLSEEFVFRACMMPLLLQSFSPSTAVFITPLFFGVAHFHHIVERFTSGVTDLGTSIVIGCFQFTYTTIFGFYSAFLFARTDHLIAPFLVHAFCNHMGVPPIHELWMQPLWRRIVSIICYIVGLLGWIVLLPIATQPTIYNNKLYWNVA